MVTRWCCCTATTSPASISADRSTCCARKGSAWSCRISEHLTPQTHAYGSIYYTLLGASHAHIALGLLLDLWLLWKLTRGLTQYRLNGFHAISFYWLAVGAITTAVTLTTLSPAL